MPQLDERGFIPEDLILGPNTLSWEEAAVECGVDRAEVAARKAAIERLHDLASEIADEVDYHLNQVGIVVDLCPWGDPEQIGPSSERVVDTFARFMAASQECRALIGRGG